MPASETLEERYLNTFCFLERSSEIPTTRDGFKGSSLLSDLPATPPTPKIYLFKINI